MRPMPVVQLALQFVAALQQVAVATAEPRQQPLDPGPEGLGRHPRPRSRLITHKAVQFGGDLQTAVADIGRGHGELSFDDAFPSAVILGLDPRIQKRWRTMAVHRARRSRGWILGSSPRMTAGEATTSD
ncbi:hypothetical protein D3C80_1488230 [compost metagenome]